MRHQLHHCGYLRVLGLDASEICGDRKGGAQVLEELCAAKGLARCVGLGDCDVLSSAEKRALLAAPAARLREEEGGTSLLADSGESRAEDLEALRGELRDERGTLVGERRR